MNPRAGRPRGESLRNAAITAWMVLVTILYFQSMVAARAAWFAPIARALFGH